MKKTLLAILAHPDDESFGIGGTLARYHREGIDVHIAIATDGIAGSGTETHQTGMAGLVSLRTKELESAVAILGGNLHRLGFRDSGYLNDPANQHPDAFINTDEEEATGRVVRLIREIKPQVIITHDKTGGYYHPDHIHCWKITTAAFHAAGDASQYPEIGPAPYQPEKLYYTAFPARWVKLFSFILRLLGRNPTQFGRNNDIDITKLGIDSNNIHAFIDYQEYWEVKGEASAQHLSQGGGAGFNRLIPVWVQKKVFRHETYMRAYPPVRNGLREDDLFNGVGSD